MSAFTRGTGVPSSITWEPTTTLEPEAEEQTDLSDAPGEDESEDEDEEDLYETPVEVRTPKEAPAQVDQYSDPQESPEEFRMEFVKEQGITGFMVKVASRLRSLKDPHERVRVRHRFWTLMRELNIDNTAQPPYNKAVADRIQQLLEERGLGETLLLDFELLLNVLEERAQKHREEDEKRVQELEEEQRRKQEWDVVKEDDAVDGWEMI